MHLLVIGGSGFIGRHFVRRATARGHEISVVSRHEKPQGECFSRCHWLGGGIEGLLASPKDLSHYDRVCHFASTVVPATSNTDPERDLRENLISLVRLLEAMRQHGPKGLLYLSSGGAIYGPPDYSPIDEDHPKRPISSYGIVKNAAEMYLRMYEDAHGLRVSIVRPSNPYGAGQTSIGQLGAVNTFLAHARDRKEVSVYGDGSIVRDFIHVEDLCAMLVSIIEQDARGIYNCGSGEGTTLNQLIEVVEEVTGLPLIRRHLPPRSFDPQVVVLDIERARSKLGWEPKISLREGVKACWESVSGKCQ